MNQKSAISFEYSAPLDGVRTIAIFGVLVYHINAAALPGGFVGVDVFFVLSGYLITSIILPRIAGGGFSLKEFYVRRIQRLLPNAVLTVVGVVVLWSLLLPPGMTQEPARHGLWTIFSLSNIYAWKFLGGYWGTRSDWAPLTHTWSLGVEEQFYLLYPTLLLGLVWVRRLPITVFLFVGTIASFGLCLYGSAFHPMAAFYLLPTRVWELLMGAVLAAICFNGLKRGKNGVLFGRTMNPRIREAVAIAGVLLIAASFVTITGSGRFPGLAALIPTGGTLLLLAAIADGDTNVGRYLSTSPMVTVGKMSYSIYLWHWPCIVLGRLVAKVNDWSVELGALVGALFGLLIAICAYRWVEQPLRKRGEGRRSRLCVIGIGVAGASALCVLASVFLIPDPRGRFNRPVVYAKHYNAGIDTSRIRGVPYSDVHFPPVQIRREVPWRSGGVISRNGDETVPSVVVLGSSHATMYARLIDDVCREKERSVAFLAVNQTDVFLTYQASNPNFASRDEFEEFRSLRMEWLKRWRPETVFLIDRWDTKHVWGAERFEAMLRALLGDLAPFAGEIVLVTQPPVTVLGDVINLRGYLNWWIHRGQNPTLMPDEREIFRNGVVEIAMNAMRDYPNLRIMNAGERFYNGDGSIRYASGRDVFYADDDHLTDIGIEEVRGLFERVLGEDLTAGTSSSSATGGEIRVD